MKRLHVVACLLALTLATGGCGGPTNASSGSDGSISGSGGSGGDPGAGGSGGSGGTTATDWTPTGGPGGFGAADLFATSSGVLLASERQVLLRSTDGGLTWTHDPGLPILTSHGYIREANGTLFASTGGAAPTLYASTDDGATWSVLQTDWRRSVPVAGPRGALWAWESAGSVYSSTDGGLTWTFESTGNGNDLHVAGGRLFASVIDALGVYDGAAWTWHSVDVAIDQIVEHGGSLFALEFHDGPVRRSDDGGATWVIDDPFAGTVRCPWLLEDGGALYVGGPSGFFARDPGGWTRVGDGVSCPRAAGGGGIWAFDEMSGVLSRFDPAAAGWATVTPQTSNTQLISLLGNDDVLFTLDRFDRTWRSTDDGASWSQTTGPGVRDAVRIGPTSWVGRAAVGGDVVRSTDEGATWQVVADNPIGVSGGLAAIGGEVFLASGRRLFHSLDAGATWTELQQAILERVSALHTDGTVLYAVGDETWRSSDGGVTFTSVASVGFTTGIVRAGAALVGWAGGGGLWISNDDGATWQQQQANPPVAHGPFVASGSDLFVASMSFLDPSEWKVWHSADLGQTWAELGSPLPASPTALRATSAALYVALDGAGVWSHPLP